MALPPNILSAFVTLFVTIGPIETAVVFASLTAGVHRQDRRSSATKAILIAGAMLTLFALGGKTALSLLQVSLPRYCCVSFGVPRYRRPGQPACDRAPGSRNPQRGRRNLVALNAFGLPYPDLGRHVHR